MAGPEITFFFSLWCLINLSYDIIAFDDVNHTTNTVLFHGRPRSGQETQTEIRRVEHHNCEHILRHEFSSFWVNWVDKPHQYFPGRKKRAKQQFKLLDFHFNSNCSCLSFLNLISLPGSQFQCFVLRIKTAAQFLPSFISSKSEELIPGVISVQWLPAKKNVLQAWTRTAKSNRPDSPWHCSIPTLS